jgi:D-beta-D-heptose 7-phosphate kinase / D-beta-D-heptose 1-phosphate adenosyltransferase
MSGNKIIDNLTQFLTESEQRKQQTVVFTNGCFDLLHEGHRHLLSEAAKLGDLLIVAVNSDASVKRLKGDSRPVEPLTIRLKNLAALETVDYVIAFSEDTPLQLIEQLQPAVLVKGGDYKKEEIIGNHLVKEVVIIPLLDGFSTTKSIQDNSKD